MRWFVEISALGQGGGASSTVCVEAAQWQPALQRARAIRGDESAFGNFSIELLDDGFRAIDPGSRLRYVVRRAPDDAVLTNDGGPGSPPKPPTQDGGAGTPPNSPREAGKTNGVTRSSAPPPATAKSPVSDAPATKAKVDQKISIPMDKPPPQQPAPAVKRSEPPRPDLPAFEIVRERAEQPSEKSPLMYREIAYAVAPGTSDAMAGRLAIHQLEQVKQELAGERAGKLVNLAIFDYSFTTKPKGRPLVTLTWKDWKGDEPEVRYPRHEANEASAAAASSYPPPASTAPSAPPRPISVAPAAKLDEAPAKPASPPAKQDDRLASEDNRSSGQDNRLASEDNRPSGQDNRPSGQDNRLASEDNRPSGQDNRLASEDNRPSGRDNRLASEAAGPSSDFERNTDVDVSAPPAGAIDTSPTVPSAKDEISVDVTLDAVTVTPEPVVAHHEDHAAPALTPVAHERPAIVSEPPPPPAPVAKAVPGSKRLAGEDLLVELFEACSDLHFLNDTLAGADFVLQLMSEKLPTEIGIVSLFDIDKRELVVVKQVGGRSLLNHRTSDKAPIAQHAMRAGRSTVVVDASRDERLAADARWEIAGVKPRSFLCAPAVVNGRYLGVIELANPLDGAAFTDADGHALTYLGQQFGEFVAALGVNVDPEAIRASAAPPPMSRKRR